MPEPSHTAAGAVAISGVSVGTVGTFLGLDTGVLFWAFLGAVIWQAANPPMAQRLSILSAAGMAVISIVIGSLGPLLLVPIALATWPKELHDVPTNVLSWLLAFVLGLVGHLLILKSADLIRGYKREGA